ncbi:MAG: hypothetical protein JWM62_2239 [Frankiales bacterium]|nr:hypothetical protein [Frankiales bacterium]
MGVLDRVDPRWVALLLVPVLLAAGAAQPEATVPRPGAASVREAPDVLLAAPRGVAPAAVSVTGVHAPAPAARQQVHVSRGAVRNGRPAPLSAEQRGRAALRALDYDPAALGYRVRFLPYRGGALGTTNRPSRLITVYVQPGQSELTLRTTLAHELGHALDFAHGTPARRDAYREVRGLPAGPWFPCDRCDDFTSPAGDFAEVFAVWLAGPGDFRSRLAGSPSPAQLRELAPLFRVPPPAAGRAAPAPSPTPTPTPTRGLSLLLDVGPSPTPDPR